MEGNIDKILKKMDTIEELYEKENKLNIILQRMTSNPEFRKKNKAELTKLKTKLKSLNCNLDALV